MAEVIDSVSVAAVGDSAVAAVVGSGDPASLFVRQFSPGFADSLYAEDYRPVPFSFDNIKVEMRPLPEGMEGEPLPYAASYDSALFIFVFSVLALVMAFVGKGRILVGQFFSRSKSRNRDIRSTANEKCLAGALVLLSIVMAGITLVCFMRLRGDADFAGMPLRYIAAASGCVAGLMLFQQCVAALVNALFFYNREDISLAKRNFSYYLIPGVLLALPVMVMLYSQGGTATGVYAALSLLALSRILFLCSTFKIFLHNIYSLFYIILYFCAVEIIPLAVMYYGAVKVFVFL